MRQTRSATPTQQQQVRYWRIDHGIRVQTLSRTIHGEKRYVPLRKRGQRLCAPMSWSDICGYVQERAS